MNKLSLINPITPAAAGTLSGLFWQRVRATPDKVAYHYYDEHRKHWKHFTWLEASQKVLKWQILLLNLGLKSGDNIAIMLKNCPDWVFSEQAALSLNMVVVPLYPNDRAENIAYILTDANIKLLVLEGNKQLESLKPIKSQLEQLTGIILLEQLNSDSINTTSTQTINSQIVHYKETFLESDIYCDLMNITADKLATIVYTSGTTGKPKGVMLSHKNILYDTWASITTVPCQSNDKFLSFLPLSHMFERTAGYYIPMMAGAEIAYARSIDSLAVDLQTVKPTVLVTVPRIFERVQQKIIGQLKHKPAIVRKLFNLTVEIGWQRFLYYQSKRSWFSGLLLWPLLNKMIARKIMLKFGGNLRLAISGGAPLSNEIAQFFIGLGVTITQGYGMTEAGPVISTNKLDDNDPFSVGQILPGIKTRISEKGELLIKADNVMMGYWHNTLATRKILNKDGWLHTGDKVNIKNNHLYITGRVKEILVLSNGEKVPPADLEMAICSDPAFEQAIIVGEAKPYLSAIVVLNKENFQQLTDKADIISLDKKNLQNKQLCIMVTKKIASLLSSFPGYEQVRRVRLTFNPWTITNGMLTPTMKLKRNIIIANYKTEIEQLYLGHA